MDMKPPSLHHKQSLQTSKANRENNQSDQCVNKINTPTYTAQFAVKQYQMCIKINESMRSIFEQLGVRCKV